jgi:hypothetical protein
MDFTQILSGLYSERDRINQAIAALEALTGTRTSINPRRQSSKRLATNRPARKKSGLTPAGRKRLSLNMKKRWAERRKKLEKSS